MRLKENRNIPTFDFQSHDGEIISLYLNLKQPKEAYCIQVVDGKTYKRIYSVPRTSHDIKVKDATFEDFCNRTTGKNLTVEEMAKISKEMAERRTQLEGEEAVNKRKHDNYEKNIGVPHEEVLKQRKLAKAKASLKKFGVTVDLSEKS